MSEGVSGAGDSVLRCMRISDGVRGPRGESGRDSLVGELASALVIGGMGKWVGGAGKEESEAMDLTEASATILAGGGAVVWVSTGSSWPGRYCGGAGEGSRFGVTAREEDSVVSCSEGRRGEYSGAGFSSRGVLGACEGFSVLGVAARPCGTGVTERFERLGASPSGRSRGRDPDHPPSQ